MVSIAIIKENKKLPSVFTQCSPGAAYKGALQMEIWKDINNFEGYYQVSNLGNIKSLPREVNHPRGVKSKKAGKLLKPKISQYGYKEVTLCKNGKSKFYRVGRITLSTFIGDCPKGNECMHLDGNSKNDLLTNLKWGTHKQNMTDRSKHNNCYKNNNNVFKKKLEYEDIIEIKKMGKLMSMKKIALRFNVSKTLISYILNGKQWKWVKNV